MGIARARALYRRRAGTRRAARQRGDDHSGGERRAARIFPYRAWDFCAPRLEPGAPELTAIRTALLDRAEHLGYALDSDPDLHLIVDGAIVPAQTVSGGVYRFDIPAGSAAVWLASRSVVPAEAEAASRDIRRLGVAVERLVLCDGDLSIEAWHAHPGLCDGFHDDEASHRWTDGLGRLPEALLRPFAAAFALELHLAPCTLEYPVSTPEHSDAAATHNTSLGGYAISPFRRELPVPVCPRQRGMNRLKDPV